jgi:hypothetical protein
MPAGLAASDPPPWAVAVPSALLTEQARNTISRDHHCATWRLPLRRLGAVVAPAAGWPCAYRRKQRSTQYPDPGALTVTVGDTGWLANGRSLPNRRAVPARDGWRYGGVMRGCLTP